MEGNSLYACIDASCKGHEHVSTLFPGCGGCSELSTLEQVQNDKRYVSLSFDVTHGRPTEAREWIEFLRSDDRIWKRIVLPSFFHDQEDKLIIMASILGALNKVESLIVNECLFHPRWVRELASLLDRTTTLKILQIDHIFMPDDPLEGPKAVNLLSSALTSYHHLEVFGLDLLSIVTDMTNNEALRELVTSISEHKSLKTLELESFTYGESITAPMFRSFENRNPKFQELKVRIDDFHNQVVVSSFNNLLQSCINLISLDLEYTSLYEAQFIQGRPYPLVHPSIIDTFLRKDSAKKLRLEYLGIDETVCSAITRGMNENSNFQMLELSNCNISAAGVSILAVGMCQNGTLQQLSLRCLDIGVGEAMAITCALLMNKTLQTLDLSSNRFGDVGAEAIAAALRVNQTLRNLYVSNCHIGDTGATALYDAISHNSTLDRFDLSRNILTAAGSKSILAALLEGNSTLKLLHFDRQQDPGDSSGGVDFNLSEEDQNKILHLESLRPMCSIPKHRLHVNRGGRKAIIDSSISLGLWPFILERALRIGYYDDELQVKHRGDEDLLRCPNNEMPRISVLYSLLQENPGLFDIPRESYLN
jgi:Ran GTPase-activating protein (RanGAP) involved in mRNA processing and transport